MPIYEYKCEYCGYEFEELFTQSEINDILEYTEGFIPIEKNHLCPKCSCIADRVVSTFSFNMNPGPLSGVDDTDDLTLGKLVAEKKIPSEFRPTIKEVQDREKFKQMDKEYMERVKKYDLDKPTQQEIDEAKGKKNILEVVTK